MVCVESFLMSRPTLVIVIYCIVLHLFSVFYARVGFVVHVVVLLGPAMFIVASCKLYFCLLRLFPNIVFGCLQESRKTCVYHRFRH